MGFKGWVVVYQEGKKKCFRQKEKHVQKHRGKSVVHILECCDVVHIGRDLKEVWKVEVSQIISPLRVAFKNLFFVVTGESVRNFEYGVIDLDF